MCTLPTLSALPRTEDGSINTSAAFGHLPLVRITYNTGPDGAWLDDDDYSAETLHGPFATEAEAQEWLQAYPDDTDVRDMDVLVLNAVRPA